MANMKLEIYNKSGEKLTDSITVSESVFGIEPHEDSVYYAVKAEMAALRQGTHSSKTKAEVSGSGKKPWRQKGTGRARVGLTRNPSRVHGGAAFGPKPRDYSMKVNRKVRRLARRSVLSQKVIDGALVVIDSFDVSTPKTKEFLLILDKLKMTGKKVTVLANEITDNIWLSSRNIRHLSVLPADSASTYDLLDNHVLLVDKAGIEALNTQLAN